MFLMCLKRSLPATAEARLVESESGDILSPKMAPDRMAPAISASLTCMVIPIPSKAMPIVEIVVNPLPIETPINEQTMNTDGTKKLPLISLKPRTMMLGMIPALIHTAISAPINRKIKIGIIAVPIPSLIPSWISSQLAPRILAQKTIKPTVKRTGICGLRPRWITDVPKIISISNRTIMASVKPIFFVFLPPRNKKTVNRNATDGTMNTVVPPD